MNLSAMTCWSWTGSESFPMAGQLHRDGAVRRVTSPDGSVWDLPDDAIVRVRPLPPQQAPPEAAPEEPPQAAPPGHPDESDELKLKRARKQAMLEMLRNAPLPAEPPVLEPPPSAPDPPKTARKRQRPKRPAPPKPKPRRK